jgi:hypothetical protein
LSYQSREKKRRYKAEAKAQRQSKRVGRQKGDPSRWWITVAQRKSTCSDCGGTIRAGSDLVYRHKPRATLCHPCAQLQGIAPAPSLKWDQRERKRRRRRTRKSIASTSSTPKAA